MFDHHSSSERLRNLVLLVVVLALVFATVGGTAEVVFDTIDKAGASMGG